ncbi:hypothetical protein QYE76_068951 [Lolium multiflorum]|uniref:Uncharacterized protein n=1 Tax=Lolium multiflorum TaxID=4521 RepID=A0AAD8SGT4_LOLMU|nr:hypothetical protein QYE76_068951 [Lolium multiflorum]
MAEPSNADAMVSGLKVSDILLPHPSLPNSMCLGPRSSESPAHLISCEANRIPFVNRELRSDLLADCLRAWPNPLKINETSSGVVEEVPMPSTAPGPSNSPRVTDQVSDQRTAKPIVTTSASLPFLGEGCDPSSLLTFDPDSIEPAAPKIGEEPNLGAVDGPLQRLKVLLSSPVDTLVEDPETIRGILVDIQPRLPVVLELNSGRQ